GSYTVTVKDANGCTNTDDVTIRQLSSTVTVTATAPDIPCGATTGTIPATAPGGPAPYTYSLDGTTFQGGNSFSNKAAGSYTVTVKDANGCTNTDDVTIRQLSSTVTGTATAPDIPCGATTGTITATATGGTAPYTYSLDGTTFQGGNSFSNKAAGSYTVTVKDANGCTNTDDVTIRQLASAEKGAAKAGG